MGNRIDNRIDAFVSTTHDGGGSQYVVHANNGHIYVFFVDQANDIVFRKSTNGGITWNVPVVVYAGTASNLSIWYDRWSNINADLIHCVYSDSAIDDTMYRTVNTASSDALSTQTNVFLGASTAGGCHLSVTRAVGGNVYCKTVIDAGAEGGFFRLPNANVPNGAWDAARTVDETIATQDKMHLLPDFDAADTQDILAIFWDNSASEISRKLYDDSGNSWGETSIAASMTGLNASTAWGNFSVAPDIANTRHVLVAWSATDTANADLRCWTVDSGAITEVTNVVLNSTDDQGLCAVGIDTATGYWYVFYAGTSAGTETWNTAVSIYYKVSTDSGTTWGPETRLTGDVRPPIAAMAYLICSPRFTGGWGGMGVVYGQAGITQGLYYSLPFLLPDVAQNVGM